MNLAFTSLLMFSLSFAYGAEPVTFCELCGEKDEYLAVQRSSDKATVYIKVNSSFDYKVKYKEPKRPYKYVLNFDPTDNMWDYKNGIRIVTYSNVNGNYLVEFNGRKNTPVGEIPEDTNVLQEHFDVLGGLNITYAKKRISGDIYEPTLCLINCKKVSEETFLQRWKDGINEIIIK